MISARSPEDVRSDLPDQLLHTFVKAIDEAVTAPVTFTPIHPDLPTVDLRDAQIGASYEQR